MSSRVSGRPRRTRIYGANYDIGQSYYKSALDDLDRKQSGRSSVLPDITPIPRTTRFNLNDTEFDSDLNNARARAHRAITEEPALFDSRGARVSRGFPLASAYGDDTLDEDVQASLSRIRAARQSQMSSLVNELDLDDTVTSFKKRPTFDLGEEIAASTMRSRALKAIADDNEDFGSSIKLRGRKIVSRVEDEEPSFASKSMVSQFKKTTISSGSSSEVADSSASLRAKASRARLADIESDMFERSEKLMEREKRAANLKKMLADTDMDDMKSVKKVTF